MDPTKPIESLHFVDKLNLVFPTWADVSAWLIPLCIILAGCILGLIAEKLIFRNIKRLSIANNFKLSQIIFSALRGIPFLWAVIIGCYEATFSLPVHGFQSHLHKIITGIFIFSLVVVVARITADLIRSYVSRLAEVIGSTSILVVVTQLLIYIIGGLVILQTMGISIMPILTALGVGGLAISLALQDTMANFFAGIYIVLSRQIKVGDYVKLDTGDEGHIADISWRTTSIQQMTKNMIIVPNTKLASAIVINYYQPRQEMYSRIPVGVSYGEDLEHVERVTLEVANAVLKSYYNTSPTLPPMMRFHTFNDFSIDFFVVFPTWQHSDKFELQHLFVKKLHERYNEEGITIPFPIRTLEIPSITDREPTDQPTSSI